MIISFIFFGIKTFLKEEALNAVFWTVFSLELLLATFIFSDFSFNIKCDVERGTSKVTYISKFIKNALLEIILSPLIFGIIVCLLTILHFGFGITSYNVYIIVVSVVSITTWFLIVGVGCVAVGLIPFAVISIYLIAYILETQLQLLSRIHPLLKW